jgi:predicted Zn-dependent peptidase
MHQKMLATAFLATVATCTPAIAQTQARQQPPPVAAERPFKFPAHTTTKLDNGLTVYVVEDHRQPVVSATLLLPAAGATAQTDAKLAGLAGMTASLLRQGTATRSAQQIAEAIDGIGGSLSAGATADSTQASVTVLTSSLDAGFGLLADIVQHPAFAPEEIERWRRQMASSLQVSYSDPEYLRDVVSDRLAYGTHPYALPTDGTPQTLRALTRDAVVAFHKAHYSPAGAYLAIAGDITPAAAAAVVKKHFGGWKAGAPTTAALPAVPPLKRRVFVVDQPEAVQTQFGMFGIGVPRNHADWLPLTVGNQIFGGSFNSRLNLRLRAKEGLTYGAGSAIASSRHAGLWGATSFTRTEETANAMKVMMEVINDFRKNPATAAELSEATAYLSGVFAIQTETAAAVAGRVLTSALHGLPADYWQTYRERVRKVSAADVTAAVERHVRPEQLTIVAVGNANAFAKTLDALGPVTVVPAARLDLTQPDLVVKQEGAAGPDAAARGLAIVKAAVEAHGGAARLAEIKDLSSTSEVTISTPGGDMQGKNTGMILYPDKTRGTIAFPFGEVVQSFDGTTGFVDVPGQGRVDLPPAMSLELRRTVLLSGGVGVLREAVNGGAQVAALESKAVEGAMLDRVSWKQGELEMVLGFDPKTRHLVNVTYRGMTQQGLADMETRLSEYKPAANGVLFPMRITTLQNGQQAVSIALTEWRVNTGITADAFKK